MNVQVSSEAQRTVQVRQQHQNQVRTQIILPLVVVAVLLFIITPFGLLILFTDRQVGIVASFAAVMVLVPTILLCVLPYALLITLIALMGKLNYRAPDLLRTGRNIAHTVNEGTHRITRTATRPIIAVSQRLAWLERLTGGEPPHAR